MLWLKKNLGPSLTGFTLYIFTSLCVQFMAILIFDEKLKIYHYIGTILVFFGVYLAKENKMKKKSNNFLLQIIIAIIINLYFFCSNFFIFFSEKFTYITQMKIITLEIKLKVDIEEVKITNI